MKKTTEMTVTELEKAIPGMDAKALKAAYAAEKAAGPDKERSTAIDALEKAAESAGVDLGGGDEGNANDAAAQEIAELKARVAKLEKTSGKSKVKPSSGNGDDRAEVLAIYRKLDAIAGHLNIRLPS